MRVRCQRKDKEFFIFIFYFLCLFIVFFVVKGNLGIIINIILSYYHFLYPPFWALSMLATLGSKSLSWPILFGNSLILLMAALMTLIVELGIIKSKFYGVE